MPSKTTHMHKELVSLPQYSKAQVNWGWQTLLYKEILRFWKVSFQTVAAPILTAILYLLIFGHILQGRVQVYGRIDYLAFLTPGLIMMSVLQNAFANSASSLVQSKLTGSLVFLLLTPIPYYGWFLAYVSAALIRAILVGLGVYLVTLFYVDFSLFSIIWIMLFLLSGAIILGALGIIAGLWADKFDQMAAFQNFIIMPMTFLSGVFYSVHSLPQAWQKLSSFNPFFYMIDGLRYGFFGVSDVSPWSSFIVVLIALVFTSYIALYLLRIGYKIKQ